MTLLNKKIVKHVSLNYYGPNYEIRKSFNSESTLNEKTKLLIVGTLTPLGEQYNYFYSGCRNRIYGYIDEALKTNLKDLNEGLRNATTKEKINEFKEKIKSILKQKNIAFLDVIKESVRLQGCDDDDIEEFSLDYESFENLRNVKYIITNSRDAEYLFYKIISTNFLNNKQDKSNVLKIEFLSQKYGPKNEWVKRIKKYSKYNIQKKC